MIRAIKNPDKEIINRILANDRAVLGELYIKYEKLVVKYVLQNGGCVSDAEDMLQEGIIVLWQNVCSGNFQLSSKLATYLMGVVKNKWRAELRKRKRVDARVINPEISDNETDTLEKVISEENHGIIRKALDSINPGCKELLMMFYFENRDLKSIAKVMGFANADVAKAKKYQCKKNFEQQVIKLMNRAERGV